MSHLHEDHKMYILNCLPIPAVNFKRAQQQPLWCMCNVISHPDSTKNIRHNVKTVGSLFTFPLLCTF